jgi:hypothetical protein
MKHVMTFSRRLQIAGAIGALGLICVAGLAVRQAALSASVGPPDPAKIAFAKQRGELLYRLDQAAWIASDFETPTQNPIPEPLPVSEGWVVEEFGASRLVTFYGYYGDLGAELVALSRLTEQNGRVISHTLWLKGADAVLSDAQRRLADAVERAQAYETSSAGVERGMRPCTNHKFNTVVIPKANGESEVYLMSAWMNPAYPMGGHYRLIVPKVGPAKFDRAVTRGCLNTPIRHKDTQQAALNVPHTLDAQPTEIHVFASLTSKLPVYVKIAGTVFAVNGTDVKQKRN